MPELWRTWCTCDPWSRKCNAQTYSLCSNNRSYCGTHMHHALRLRLLTFTPTPRPGWNCLSHFALPPSIRHSLTATCQTLPARSRPERSASCTPSRLHITMQTPTHTCPAPDP